MSAAFEIKTGDTKPFRVRLLDVEDAMDLTTASAVRLKVRNSVGAIVINGAMVVEDQATYPGWVRRAWGVGETAIAGWYLCEVEVTWADATLQTFPDASNAAIHMIDDLD